MNRSGHEREGGLNRDINVRSVWRSFQNTPSIVPESEYAIRLRGVPRKPGLANREICRRARALGGWGWGQARYGSEGREFIEATPPRLLSFGAFFLVVEKEKEKRRGSKTDAAVVHARGIDRSIELWTGTFRASPLLGGRHDASLSVLRDVAAATGRVDRSVHYLDTCVLNFERVFFLTSGEAFFG